MEISDCIWDDSFLCSEVLEDLQNPLAQHLSAPFSWPEETVQDEADNCDMTPQCMPVIDPNFVRENLIEDCLLDGIARVSANGEEVLGGYLIDDETSSHFSRLHILVCGFCHTVYHVVDEFKSHLMICDGSTRNTNFSSYQSNSAVALVLWTNAVLRRMKAGLTEVGSSVSANLTQRIEARWWRLSKKSRQVWEKAAEALRELAMVGSLLFPGPGPATGDPPHQREGEGGPGERMHWPGPHDFREADEIEIQGSIKEEEYEDCGVSSSLSTLPPDSPQVVDDEPFPRPPKVPPPSQARDTQGRWRAKNPARPATGEELECRACSFSTHNPWKMARHNQTAKHMANLRDSLNSNEAISSSSSSSSSLNEDSRSSGNPTDTDNSQCGNPTVPLFRRKKSAKAPGLNFTCVQKREHGLKRKSAISANEKVTAWVQSFSRSRDPDTCSQDKTNEATAIHPEPDTFKI